MFIIINSGFFVNFVAKIQINNLQNMALGKSAKYYTKHKAARDKKKAYDTQLNSRPEQVKKRVESNRAVRKRKASGKSTKGKDFDHAVGKFVSVKTNRGRRGEGGRKKKS